MKKIMKIFSEIREMPEFKKDVKKLARRFPTLKEDLQVFIKRQLKTSHKLKIDNKGVFQIPELGINYPKIYKAKKFACKSLKGKGVFSGIRVIYAYWEKENVIEFIEIYYKGDKENEDRERILKYYGGEEL